MCEEVHSYLPEKVPWSEEELRKEQKRDTECKRIRRAMQDNEEKNKKWLKFKVINSILFVHRTIKRGELSDEFLVPVIPDRLMEQAFKIIHVETTAGHTGFERTLKLFRRNFYHYRESEIIRKNCEECESCIKVKACPKNNSYRKISDSIETI